MLLYPAICVSLNDVCTVVLSTALYVPSCLSNNAALWFYPVRYMPRHVSLTLHCGDLGCSYPTLTAAAAHRYVLVRPLWIPPWLSLDPCMDPSLDPCSRTFSPEAGM